ncbi:hypothetical protein PLESTB_000726300 [Pleodorina starrii]|uniref:valine--tRNA ligase n=1 Tax=Pleodorina starrii TaxID=330485 RepID=A0A9W6F2J2_9CHLO|nr:hypothetical protein PLESTM_000197800 [Pleodorina starrii]GLC53266.1 hypothetical protein PLESTB_000726300 [Pleodorina starrii]GLC67262.1 hypothetical protein PLESTF_000534700 [Pleodorina starrii]
MQTGVLGRCPARSAQGGARREEHQSKQSGMRVHPCRSLAARLLGSNGSAWVQGRPAAATIGRRQLAPALQAAAVQEVGTVAGSRPELPKNFEANTAEERIYKWWESQGYFKPDSDAPGEPFTISMPPPNVTGKLHMGHAMFATVQDIMTRHARMSGRKALWLPGTDHAGIATQSVVEKMLAREGLSRLELGREEFTRRVWQWKEEYGGFITNQLRRLGASCDWSRERFTLDEGLSDAVAEAFVRLHSKGLIYRGQYMVNWSPALRTAVSDLEVEYGEEAGNLFYFKYPVADSPSGEYLPVATTRPETILGDTAVAVHPEDERYKHLIGRECEVPLSGGRRIPIIGDEYVDREFGTGALKITPGHDINDYEIGKRRGLPTINIMNKDATLNAAAGPKYAGMERFAARKALWADMEAAGLALKKEPHTSRVPRSQRSGEVIEPLVSEQWFVRMGPLAEPALAAVADGSITILPERFAKTYNNWLENIKDWCISRQLWWGHRIPVWYIFPSAEAAQAAPEGRGERYVVARNQAEAQRLAEEAFGPEVVLRQEEDVLDTWFSSGLWPFSTLGWPRTDSPDYQTFYPTQMMETGHDILFFWVARMIMMGIEFTGRPPFSTIYLHGLVRDDKGRKMSKSLGNVVDPLDTIGQYGTDALRFTLATGTGVGQDLNLSLERVTASRNFTNKMWNAGKFVLFNLDKVSESEWESLRGVSLSSPADLQRLPLVERWIVSLLHQTVDEVSERYDKYDYNAAGISAYNFLWDEFADWFIEASKTRTYGGDAAAQAASRAALVYVYEVVLRLLHPFMPFVTEELWQALPHRGDALIMAPWPSRGCPVDSSALAQFEVLKGCVRALRNARAEYNVEPARKIGATLVVEEQETRRALESELAVVCLLAKLDPAAVRVVGSAAEAEAASSSAVNLVVAEGVQVVLPLAGLFDVGKELARLSKQKTKLDKDLAGVLGRLNNPAFMAKASPEYVEEARAQEREAREKLALVEDKIAQVSALKAATAGAGK